MWLSQISSGGVPSISERRRCLSPSGSSSSPSPSAELLLGGDGPTGPDGTPRFALADDVSFVESFRALDRRRRRCGCRACSPADDEARAEEGREAEKRRGRGPREAASSATRPRGQEGGVVPRRPPPGSAPAAARAGFSRAATARAGRALVDEGGATTGERWSRGASNRKRRPQPRRRRSPALAAPIRRRQSDQP